jgi:hypothetical protein
MVFFLNELPSCPLAPLPNGKQLSTGRLAGVVYRGHRHGFAPRVVKAAVRGERQGGGGFGSFKKNTHLKTDHEGKPALRRLSVVGWGVLAFERSEHTPPVFN